MSARLALGTRRRVERDEIAAIDSIFTRNTVHDLLA